MVEGLEEAVCGPRLGAVDGELELCDERVEERGRGRVPEERRVKQVAPLHDHVRIPLLDQVVEPVRRPEVWDARRARDASAGHHHHALALRDEQRELAERAARVHVVFDGAELVRDDHGWWTEVGMGRKYHAFYFRYTPCT